MRSDHDLAMQGIEDLRLRPDAVPTPSYDDDEHYHRYISAKYMTALEPIHPTDSDVLGPYSGEERLIARRLRRLMSQERRY